MVSVYFFTPQLLQYLALRERGDYCKELDLELRLFLNAKTPKIVFGHCMN